MQAQVHTDRTIDRSEAFEARVAGVVESALHRSIDQVASVDVRLSDENADKEGGRDQRCLMEARLEHTVGRRRDLARHRTDPASGISGGS